jgi:hypothetical protein
MSGSGKRENATGKASNTGLTAPCMRGIGPTMPPVGRGG